MARFKVIHSDDAACIDIRGDKQWPFTLLPFTSDADFAEAKRIASVEGFGDSFAYTSSSGIPGCFLFPLKQEQSRNKVIVKTAEHGFAVINFYSE